MTASDKKDFWTVDTSKVDSDLKKLPQKIRELAALLFRDIEIFGPIRKDWDNFSSLGKRKKVTPQDAYHCHLKKGNPTYVACWNVIDKNKKQVKVYYVGTHEKAPY